MDSRPATATESTPSSLIQLPLSLLLNPSSPHPLIPSSHCTKRCPTSVRMQARLKDPTVSNSFNQFLLNHTLGGSSESFYGKICMLANLVRALRIPNFSRTQRNLQWNDREDEERRERGMALLHCASANWKR
ncbi:hypothetical protein IE53DRAFT_11391 [Violaceomyces palustris]|uniref:Uncharacterized protein n=1 Tax=Violaceomyces palustris TaxID=1673888 RepID=A0ACD0P2I8_9BASI|nr:hypothetical protein IE53DRAFT_11391 [Violaceomyces palustris]